AVAIIAVVAFVMYRLREFRKEAAEGHLAAAGPGGGAPGAGSPPGGGPAAGGPPAGGPGPGRRSAPRHQRTAGQDDQPRPRSPMS
ncbi:MAG TPA: hypothetical protein VF933_29780, partial [Streptosporangiaceae bacterium]